MIAFLLLLCYNLCIMSSNGHEQPPQNQYSTMNFLLNTARVALELGIQAESHAAEQTALAERMQEAAQLDPLTGLQNRRALVDTYKQLQATDNQRRRHRGSNQPVALLLADVDTFKSINDEYGHNVGDDVLKGVAQLMSQSVRQRDVVARWGGEEFAMLLPRADRKTALRVAEGVRKNAETGDLMAGVENDRPVTLSLGVTMVDLLEPLELSMAKADLALYAAKHQGRNQVVFASELPKIPKLQEIELIPAKTHPVK
jgi:diguanylate cyclase (GGDEF)-like protein